METNFIIELDNEALAHFRDEALAVLAFNEVVESMIGADHYIALVDIDGRILEDNTLTLEELE